MSYLNTIEWEKTTPAYATTQAQKILKETLNHHDPYYKVKKEFNEKARHLYPRLREMVENSDDRFFTAVKLAIIGNIIDFGAVDEFDIDETLSNILKNGLDICHYTEFKEAVSQATNILYLADNTGEIFFDRILIEELRGIPIILVVKEAPILNDATIEDAKLAGLDKLAKIIKSKSAVGTPLEDTTKEVLDAFKDSDLIISKGQGNYETLKDSDLPIFFLFQAKCKIVAQHLGLKLYDAILMSNKNKK
jgi:hypothetical protein